MVSKNEEILGVWSELFVGQALAVRAVESDLAGKAPLSISEYDVLLCVSRSHERAIRFSALAEAAVYTKSGITRVVKRLEDEGLLMRRECPEDKRVTYAVLTEAGDRALRETWRWYSQSVSEILSPCFTQQEAQTLRELLGRIVHKLSRPELIQIRTSRSGSATKLGNSRRKQAGS